ncbi:MAG: hypothetical protein EP314_06395 [Bacteroidetes bacterium]|nr:MAG: hypothetical protein EP314_06395 [Bacteroidota bacterium]
MRIIPLLLLLLTFADLFAQDEDYYAPEKTRPVVTEQELNQLYRWGPKLGIEAYGSIGYSHFYAPPTISGAFDKTNGGFGYDAGVGARIRIYHKLAIGFGYAFSGRGYNMSLMAQAEVDTGNGTAIVDVRVDEKANMTYMGFYIKPIIELSRKFHLALLFKQTYMLTYRGTSTQTITGGPSSWVGSVGVLQNESSMEIEPQLFEFGLEFAYKWTIAPQFIMKPHIGINFGTSAIFHTGAELPTPFGGWEQNPSFMTLRLGVIFESGVWMDKLKK